jgi:hypothetical protein
MPGREEGDGRRMDGSEVKQNMRLLGRRWGMVERPAKGRREGKGKRNRKRQKTDVYKYRISPAPRQYVAESSRGVTVTVWL